MKLKQLRLLLAFFSVTTFTSLQAQESINAAGGNSLGNGGTVSYSFGQVATQTHASNTGSLAEGVQQVYEISVVTDIFDRNEIQLSVKAYPNPTTDKLILSMDVINPEDYSYQLYQMQGRLIESSPISSSKTSIAMQHLVPATYFVKVISGSRAIKTFKIIKR